MAPLSRNWFFWEPVNLVGTGQRGDEMEVGLSVGSRGEGRLPFSECGVVSWGGRGEYEGIRTGMVWLGSSHGADSLPVEIM